MSASVQIADSLQEGLTGRNRGEQAAPERV